jgi:hypothetical protein
MKVEIKNLKVQLRNLPDDLRSHISSLHTLENTLIKWEHNFLEFQKLYNHIQLFLADIWEKRMPLSVDPEELEEFCMALSCFLVFCGKYGTKTKSQFEEMLLRKGEFFSVFQMNSLIRSFSDDFSYLRFSRKNIPQNTQFIKYLMIFDVLVNQNFLIPVLFIDPADLFLTQQRVSNQKMIVESITVSASTLGNIEKAIVNGLLLVIEDPDDDLIKACQPLLSWILKKINSSIYLNLGSFKGESIKSIPETIKRPIDFHGKMIKMHDSFRFCFVVHDNSLALPGDFLNKVNLKKIQQNRSMFLWFLLRI